MRPRSLDRVVGHPDLLGPGKLLDQSRSGAVLPSILFWGPPGSGKTTLATLMARSAGLKFQAFSAVLSGVKEVRAVVAEARELRNRSGQGTVLFVDEIHRFNKAQQDAFLPHVESGLITLLGATTENPSFEIIPALLSRVRVAVLSPLSSEALGTILQRALTDPDQGLGGLNLELTEKAAAFLVDSAQGDARALLNGLEVAAGLVGPEGEIGLSAAQEAVGRRALIYDKSGEEHYNLISAFHKSLRGSDPDAALYWLARMLLAGENPLYIGRRMVRAASEDVGNADPRALALALDAVEAFRFLGPPEGELALAQAAIYIAAAPKSNAVYTAYDRAKGAVEKGRAKPVPIHLRNAPTKLMREAGYGKAYLYPHDFPEAVVEQEYFPGGLEGQRFYYPKERGYEVRIKERLDYWRALIKKDGGRSKGPDVAAES